MKVFVTGGTGFLGQHVLRALVADGHKVKAMVRREHAALPPGVEPERVALRDEEGLTKALKGRDAIIHLAGKVSRRSEDALSMYRLHGDGTRALLNAAERAKVTRFVLASTSGTIAVQREAGAAPATEADDAPLDIIGGWPYYHSKRLQEEEVMRRHRAGRIEAVVLNPSLLLGPGDERLSSTQDVLDVLLGRVPIVTEGTAALVDVRDAAPSFVRALKSGTPGARYLLNGANMSVRRLIERIAHAGQVAPPRLVVPKAWAMAGARLMQGLYRAVDRTAPIPPLSVEMAHHHWQCDARRAESELGFEARDPQETIHDTVVDLETRGLFRRSQSA